MRIISSERAKHISIGPRPMLIKITDSPYSPERAAYTLFPKTFITQDCRLD